MSDDAVKTKTLPWWKERLELCWTLGEGESDIELDPSKSQFQVAAGWDRKQQEPLWCCDRRPLAWVGMIRNISSYSTVRWWYHWTKTNKIHRAQPIRIMRTAMALDLLRAIERQHFIIRDNDSKSMVRYICRVASIPKSFDTRHNAAWSFRKHFDITLSQSSAGRSPISGG